MQSPLVELPQQGSEFSSLLQTCTLKARRSEHQESALVFPVVHVLTLLIARFYFSNVSNTILNISEYTACGCSTSSLTSQQGPAVEKKSGTCCSQEMLHSVHLPASYRNYNYESMEFLGFNNVTYIYHKVGLFQIM